MAIGTPLVTNRTPALEAQFTEGAHYLGFDDVDEMLAQIGWVLEHESAAGTMARLAREEVLSKHTYTHRVGEMFR